MADDHEGTGGASRPGVPGFGLPFPDPMGFAAIAERGMRDMASVLSSLLGASGAPWNGAGGSPFGARPRSATPDHGDATADVSDGRPPLAEAFRTVDTYADVAKGLIEQFYAGIGSGAAPVDSGVRLTGAPGSTVESEWWIANPDHADLDDAGVTATPLTNAAGTTLDAQVCFEPAGAVDMPARSTRAVTVRVVVPDDAVAGRYRGVLQARALPHVGDVVELTVEDG